MKKPNVFRSSNFWMDEGDELHILLIDEAGTPATFTLNTEYADGTTNQFDAPDPPVAISASDISSSGFTANWYYSENALGYYLDVATDSAFTSMVVGYNNLNVGFVNEYGVIGLDDAITYYYRLRAYNDYGTSGESNIIVLTTSVSLVQDFDGNTYTYVTIGTQQWMVENFRSEHYNDGTPIPNLTLNADWMAEDGTLGHDGAMCYYDNDEATYKDDYGVLYNWYAVDNAHGLAIATWRVPSEADFTTLSTYLGGSLVSGGKLKEDGLSHWQSPNTGADNSSGFTGIGSGDRDSSTGNFASINDVFEIWFSTTERAVRLSSSGADSTLIDAANGNGFSVRLMRDI